MVIMLTAAKHAVHLHCYLLCLKPSNALNNAHAENRSSPTYWSNLKHKIFISQSSSHHCCIHCLVKQSRNILEHYVLPGTRVHKMPSMESPRWSSLGFPVCWSFMVIIDSHPQKRLWSKTLLLSNGAGLWTKERGLHRSATQHFISCWLECCW